MDSDENKQSNAEQDSSELDRNVEIDKIVEFYKDKLPNNDLPEKDTPDDIAKTSRATALLTKLRFTSCSRSEDGIETETIGMSELSRFVIQCVITAVVCAAIIVGSVVLAYYLPGNAELLEQRITELRNDDDYQSLKSRHDSLANEIDELKIANEDKQATLDGITDVDNTKAELRQAISEKATQLNDLNQQIASKQAEIQRLDESISSKAAPETVYSPGKYTVGTNIAVGKYYVTGTGKFMVASSDGKSKVNTTLTSAPIEVALEQNDIVKFDSKVKFTSAN